MKKFKIHYLICFFCLTAFCSYGQEAQFIQGWKMIGESDTFIDVTYCVFQCDDQAEVYLNVFNEHGEAQIANFDIILTDTASGDQMVHEIRGLEMALAEMKIAECGNSTNDHLKLSLPEGYDPATVQVSVNFN